MNISAPFIKRPAATTLLTAALALSGILAFQFLPVAPLPAVAGRKGWESGACSGGPSRCVSPPPGNGCAPSSSPAPLRPRTAETPTAETPATTGANSRFFSSHNRRLSRPITVSFGTIFVSLSSSIGCKLDSRGSTFTANCCTIASARRRDRVNPACSARSMMNSPAPTAASRRSGA